MHLSYDLLKNNIRCFAEDQYDSCCFPFLSDNLILRAPHLAVWRFDPNVSVCTGLRGEAASCELCLLLRQSDKSQLSLQWIRYFYKTVSRDTDKVSLVTIAKCHKLPNSLTCWNWYLYLTAGNGMITNWDLGNFRARMMSTGWATTTSMTCSLEVQVFSLHRFLSKLHEIVHLTGHHFVFRRELIKDWLDGLAGGKTLCSLWKFPACQWAGKKWREWRFACCVCEGGAAAYAASDFSY